MGHPFLIFETSPPKAGDHMKFLSRHNVWLDGVPSKSWPKTLNMEAERPKYEGRSKFYCDPDMYDDSARVVFYASHHINGYCAVHGLFGDPAKVILRFSFLQISSH